MNKKIEHIQKTKKKVSNLKKLLIGLFTLISLGFGAAMHMLTDIEQDLIKAETMISAETYMGAECPKK